MHQHPKTRKRHDHKETKLKADDDFGPQMSTLGLVRDTN